MGQRGEVASRGERVRSGPRVIKRKVDKLLEAEANGGGLDGWSADELRSVVERLSKDKKQLESQLSTATADNQFMTTWMRFAPHLSYETMVEWKVKLFEEGAEYIGYEKELWAEVSKGKTCDHQAMVSLVMEYMLSLVDFDESRLSDYGDRLSDYGDC